MKKHLFKLLFVLPLAITPKLFAQTTAPSAGASLPKGSAVQDVSSATKATTLPRMTQKQVNNIDQPATGLIVYNTSISALQVNAGTTASPVWHTLNDMVANWIKEENNGTGLEQNHAN